MNPSAAAAETSVSSLLDKPLDELTEEDIAQLTREDCRRFLKQKGMRRPSWNKSQAIQQVISLKALLEDRPRKKPHPPPPPLTSPQVKPSHSQQQQQQRVEDPSPYRWRDPNPILVPPAALLTWDSRAVLQANVAARDQLLSSPSDNTDISPGPPSPLTGAQMTIFYGGLVNVYNEVPVEKARAIMQVAETPVNQSDPMSGPVQLNRGQTRAVLGAFGPVPAGGVFQSWPAAAGPSEWTRPPENEENPTGRYNDCPIGRQASLQRYLEKRKGRYKGKRIIGGSTSSMEMMFLSQKLRIQTPNGQQSSQSNTTSLTQPRAPCTPTRCSRTENGAKKSCVSFDLNDDVFGVEESCEEALEGRAGLEELQTSPITAEGN